MQKTLITRYRAALLLAVLTVTALTLPALRTGSAQAINPVNVSKNHGVAIKGTDPVAYFTQGRPVKGSKAHEYQWNGARWWFASAENREKFAKAPEDYAPRYGGYCAWAVSQGYTADIDPAAWKIVNGKLYLNYSKSVQKQWMADMEALIVTADGNWPRLLSGK